MANVKLTGKAKLKADLAQLKVKVQQAQDELNATLNGVPLKERNPAAWEIADKKFKDAIIARDTMQAALENYKEPEKPKSAKQIEAERQKSLLEGQVPAPGGIVSGQPNVSQNKEVQPENFDELAKTARDYVKNKLDNAGRLTLANSLNAAGIANVPLTGEYTDALTTAYKNAIGSAKSAWNAYQEYPTLSEFITEQTRQANALKAAGGAGGTQLPEATGVQQVYDKSTAEGTIDSLFQSFLKRDASQSEIDSLYKQLDAEQKKASSISTSKYKMVNGVKVRVDQINFDPKVFLENKIKELPTYKESQAAKSEQNKLSLASTALANGYDLERDFSSQLPNWLDAINKGESISKFQSTIRNSARLALPEAVRNSIDPTEDLTTAFATYINNYSKTFGVPADQVSLNKILPLATNDKGFIPIYEFEKKKRQLAEWDKTPEARTETANVVSTVLKDFGFKG